MKNANTSLVYNKKACCDRSNYRRVSGLLLSSKPFQGSFYEQIVSHTKGIWEDYTKDK